METQSQAAPIYPELNFAVFPQDDPCRRRRNNGGGEKKHRIADVRSEKNIRECASREKREVKATKKAERKSERENERLRELVVLKLEKQRQRIYGKEGDPK